MLVIVGVMCVVGFAAGAVIGWSAQADPPQRASLMFGLGMTNNGIGLVIAAGALSHIPAVMLPIIFYNLIQHVVAGCVYHYWLGGNDISPHNQPLRLISEACFVFQSPALRKRSAAPRRCSCLSRTAR